MERFAKKSNFYSIHFFYFFAKRRNSVEKMTHRKKSRGHRTFKIVKSTQSYSNGHLPYYCSRCMTWRSKDAQKQLARTSLRLCKLCYDGKILLRSKNCRLWNYSLNQGYILILLVFASTEIYLHM